MTGPAIRAMTAADLGVVLGWAEAEGWNPGLDDAQAFHAADPAGFLLAEVGGEPVASLSIVRFAATGFLGLFICVPGQRGRGHGAALWREGLDRLAPGGMPVGLDGVPAQQARYGRSGFAPSHRTLRHAGRIETWAPDPTRPLARADLPAARALDRAVTGFDRGAFLTDWLGGGPRRITRVLERDGALAGLGTLRACVSGWKVGPLLAADRRAAEGVLDGLAHVADGAPLSLDLPEPNGEARAMAEARGLVPVFETARMWRGPAPKQDLARTFGVATLELG